MYETCPTVTWLRTRYSDTANTAAAPAKIATLAFRLSYMPSMKPSMITAIDAPMTSAM